MLRAENISLHIAGFDLLRDISVVVEPGKVTAVVGPNGAGKSSLLRVMTGEIAATGGEMMLNGRRYRDWTMAERARMLAVLPQETPLDFPFTAREVVSLGRTPHDTGNIRDREIVGEVLARVDATYLDKRHYTQMSGGEKQRVQFARVLAQIWEPCGLGDRFLILDEPTAAFDLSHQNMTLDIVGGFAREGVGVLIVLHDLNLASRCADNLVVLSCGVIADQGPPERVITSELVEQVFAVKAVISRHPLTNTPLVLS